MDDVATSIELMVMCNVARMTRRRRMKQLLRMKMRKR